MLPVHLLEGRPVASPDSSGSTHASHADVPEHRARWLTLEGFGVELGARPVLALIRGEAVHLRAHDHACRLPVGSVLACDGREPGLSLHTELPLRSRLLCLWPDPRVLVGPQAGLRACARLLPLVHAPGSEVALRMEALAHELAGRGVQDLDDGIELHGWLAGVLAGQDRYEDFMSRCTGRTRARRRELFVRLWRTRVLLDSLDSEPAEVIGLAGIARMSPSHFVRQFHRVFGEPPHKFRKRRRMERAWQLLYSTDLPIHEIMWRSGYDSHPCFARAFRSHFGVSASAAREAVRVGNQFVSRRSRVAAS